MRSKDYSQIAELLHLLKGRSSQESVPTRWAEQVLTQRHDELDANAASCIDAGDSKGLADVLALMVNVQVCEVQEMWKVCEAASMAHVVVTLLPKGQGAGQAGAGANAVLVAPCREAAAASKQCTEALQRLALAQSNLEGKPKSATLSKNIVSVSDALVRDLQWIDESATKHGCAAKSVPDVTDAASVAAYQAWHAACLKLHESKLCDVHPGGITTTALGQIVAESESMLQHSAFLLVEGSSRSGGGGGGVSGSGNDDIGIGQARDILQVLTGAPLSFATSPQQPVPLTVQYHNSSIYKHRHSELFKWIYDKLLGKAKKMFSTGTAATPDVMSDIAQLDAILSKDQEYQTHCSTWIETMMSPVHAAALSIHKECCLGDLLKDVPGCDLRLRLSDSD